MIETLKELRDAYKSAATNPELGACEKLQAAGDYIYALEKEVAAAEKYLRTYYDYDHYAKSREGK
tara:strand:+ start:766 stop:960 length:195 start_codon:yes stop_codon:yes gene_type:complete